MKIYDTDNARKRACQVVCVVKRSGTMVASLYLDHKGVYATCGLLHSIDWDASKAGAMVDEGRILRINADGSAVKMPGLPLIYPKGKIDGCLHTHLMQLYRASAVFVYRVAKKKWTFSTYRAPEMILPVNGDANASCREWDRCLCNAMLAEEAAKRRALREHRAEMARHARERRAARAAAGGLSFADRMRLEHGQVKLEMLPTAGAHNYTDACAQRKSLCN